MRPGAVHGRFSHHLREWYLVKRALDQRPQVVLPFNGESVFQPTATVNLAELVALAASKPGHRTLNCGDQNPPTVTHISAIIDDLLNWSTERVLVAGPRTSGRLWGTTPGPSPARGRRYALGPGRARLPAAGQVCEALVETVPWVVEACSGRDWREVLPVLAKYPDLLIMTPRTCTWQNEFSRA